MRTAEEMIARLGLRPLDQEGSWWAPGPRTRNLSAITVLLTMAADGFSALHRLTFDEGWQWLDGSPARILRLGPGGGGRLDPLERRTGQVLVPAGTWQGAATLGAWTLLTCWRSPAFTWEGFMLGDREALQRGHPEWEREIEALTRAAAATPTDE